MAQTVISVEANGSRLCIAYLRSIECHHTVRVAGVNDRPSRSRRLRRWLMAPLRLSLPQTSGPDKRFFPSAITARFNQRECQLPHKACL